MMFRRIGLPEIGLPGMMLLSIAGVIGGIVLGTQMSWWVEVLTCLAFAYAIEHSDLELGAVAYLVPLILLITGCIIGDISWFVQTGGVAIHGETFTNPFLVK